MINPQLPLTPDALLAWYAEMGVDVALDEEPRDRIAPAGPPVPPPSAPAVSTEAQGDDPPSAISFRPVVPDPVLARPQDETVQAARDAAARATTLEELRATLERFEGLALRKTATQLVFADGNPAARVMFVGEAPGRDEDREGRPFVGRAGQLLDKMLASIGLDRSGAYIANVIPWRPPGNRTPTPQETETCIPFVRRQIELVDPEFLVLLGAASTQALLGAREGILRLRGRWFDYDAGGRQIRALATLHPAYLLRTPLQKRLAWRDLRALKATLDASPPR